MIFDIMLNIENLYSIGAVEEEMQVAMTYYRSLGMDSEIVNEQFRVVDEVRDCMELFEKLNDSLTASWELMYHYAQRYVEENGIRLGAWLNNIRSGEKNTNARTQLTENQKVRLR